MQGNFEAVWSRVTGSTPQKQRDTEAQQLLRFLQETADGAAAYQWLLRQTRSNRAVPLLHRCYREKRLQAKKLSSAYYLLTGENCGPLRPAGSPPRTWSEALRERYRRETEAAEDFRAEALRCSPDLQDLYRHLAQQEAQHAFLLRRIIEGLF